MQQRPSCGRSYVSTFPLAGQPEGKGAAAAEPCASMRQVSAAFSAKLALFKVTPGPRVPSGTRAAIAGGDDAQLCGPQPAACIQHAHTSFFGT